MPLPSTMTPIATTTGSGASSITFSSIPSTYTDLTLVVGGTVSSGVSCYIRINGDTGSNYSYTYLQGDGTSASSGRASNATWMYYGPMHDQGNTIIMQLQSYSNTSVNKTVLFRQNSHLVTGTVVGLWRNTSAINSVTVITGGVQTFPSTTSFTLYGIKAA